MLGDDTLWAGVFEKLAVSADGDSGADPATTVTATVAATADAGATVLSGTTVLSDGTRLSDGTVQPDATALSGATAVLFARFERFAEITVAARAVLASAPARFALAGHSLGGMIALEIMQLEPERVSRLALLNTSARPPSDAQRQGWATLGRRTIAGEFSQVALETTIAGLAPDRHSDEALIVRGQRMAATVGAAGFLRQLALQSSRRELRATLAAIAVPTLVIGGALDSLSPPDRQKELAALIPGAGLKIFANCGHLSPLEHPDAVAAALRDWLS